MSRRATSGLDVIASMPWPFGVAMGVLAFVGIQYAAPWWLAKSDNLILQGFGRAASTGALTPLAWILLLACWLASGVSFLRSRQRRRLLDVQTGLESVAALRWREFELFVGEAFRRQGYAVQEFGGGGPDGGIDLLLRRDGRVELVQCKQWRTRQIKVQVVREMWGLAAHHRAHGVKIVCVGEYTRDAERFALGKPIELLNGQALLSLLQSVQSPTYEEVQVPRPTPLASTSAIPACPNCGSTMIQRQNRSNQQSFWGCSAYPRCKGTREAS